MAVGHKNVGYCSSDLDCGRYEDLRHASVIATNCPVHISVSKLPLTHSRRERVRVLNRGVDVDDRVARWHEQTAAHSSGGG